MYLSLLLEITADRLFASLWDLLRCRDISISLSLKMRDLSIERHPFDWQSHNIHQSAITTKVGSLIEMICFPIFTAVWLTFQYTTEWNMRMMLMLLLNFPPLLLTPFSLWLEISLSVFQHIQDVLFLAPKAHTVNGGGVILLQHQRADTLPELFNTHTPGS